MRRRSCGGACNNSAPSFPVSSGVMYAPHSLHHHHQHITAITISPPPTNISPQSPMARIFRPPPMPLTRRRLRHAALLFKGRPHGCHPARRRRRRTPARRHQLRRRRRRPAIAGGRGGRARGAVPRRAAAATAAAHVVVQGTQAGQGLLTLRHAMGDRARSSCRQRRVALARPRAVGCRSPLLAADGGLQACDGQLTLRQRPLQRARHLSSSAPARPAGSRRRRLLLPPVWRRRRLRLLTSSVPLRRRCRRGRGTANSVSKSRGSSTTAAVDG